MLAQADYVSLHVPLTSKTRHMIDRQALAAMKPTAVLINVARGEIADEGALVEALQSGRIRGAGLDVFAEEPLPPDHPLLQMPNVVATPHTAGQTYGTSRRRGETCAENVDTDRTRAGTAVPDYRGGLTAAKCSRTLAPGFGGQLRSIPFRNIIYINDSFLYWIDFR